MRDFNFVHDAVVVCGSDTILCALYDFYVAASIAMGAQNVTPEQFGAMDAAGLRVRELIGVPEGCDYVEAPGNDGARPS